MFVQLRKPLKFYKCSLIISLKYHLVNTFVIYFTPMSHFSTPWKHQKNRRFLKFLVDIKLDIGMKRVKICATFNKTQWLITWKIYFSYKNICLQWYQKKQSNSQYIYTLRLDLIVWFVDIKRQSLESKQGKQYFLSYITSIVHQIVY